jgi:hypothetical protein
MLIGGCDTRHVFRPNNDGNRKGSSGRTRSRSLHFSLALATLSALGTAPDLDRRAAGMTQLYPHGREVAPKSLLLVASKGNPETSLFVVLCAVSYDTAELWTSVRHVSSVMASTILLCDFRLLPYFDAT